MRCLNNTELVGNVESLKIRLKADVGLLLTERTNDREELINES